MANATRTTKPKSSGSKRGAKSAPVSRARVSKGAIPRLRVRMYRHGLGDCLLLRFRRPSKNSTFNVLIDCGLISVASEPKKVMIRVAEDIKSTCSRLDVIVMTHEHWDHASGFSAQQARDVFADMEIGEVWYAWTEDPRDELGRKLRKERADKVAALTMATTALAKLKGNPLAAARARNLGALLGFFGMDQVGTTPTGASAIGKTRDAFEYLMRRQDVKTRYCSPEKEPLSLGDVENVRVFVLGPPHDESMIKRSSPTKTGREVYEFASESSLASNIAAAFSRLNGTEVESGSLDDCPFDDAVRRKTRSGRQRSESLMQDIWNAPGEEWRRIEDDWTQVAETLALNLDTHTNNTCLVLAFQFIDTGEVFLFPADAQVGNWLSWQTCQWKIRTPQGVSETTGPELLGKTVFYKVGHHGSHNATLRALGLEQMTSEELVAFIPVFKDQAQKNRWMSMPFEPLVRRLREKTRGRILQSDQPPPTTQQLVTLPKKAQAAFLSSVTVGRSGLYFEYCVG